LGSGGLGGRLWLSGPCQGRAEGRRGRCGEAGTGGSWPCEPLGNRMGLNRGIDAWGWCGGAVRTEPAMHQRGVASLANPRAARLSEKAGIFGDGWTGKPLGCWGGLGERACRGEELIVGRAGPGDHGLRYLRKNRKRFDGEFYESWILCETMRTERGPQQRGGGLAREAWRGGPAEGLGRPGDASGRAPPRTAAKGSRTRMTEGKRPDWAGSGSTCWSCGGRKAGSWGTLFLALVLWRGLDLQESALIPTWLLRSEPNPCGTTRCGSSGGTSFVFAAPKA
jgi:hypothetical protein